MALRKLQAEIDRTLKTVAQGVESFESTFDKLNLSNNASQKDKLENDLKTQIKKLQRMRDQIKAWMGNGDIKDKSSLLENRKLIETQMERFKALEKEMKMKAFSKEGLIAQSKMDPAEKAKREIVEWIGSTTEELSRQIEQTEAEAEQISSMKKKKSQGDRLGELEELNERRSWHIGRLEVVQRMLENGQLQVDGIEAIQEDVKYFVEANAEEDYEYDIGIYDELNLQEEEEFPTDFHQDDVSNIDSVSLADTNPDPIPAPIAPKTPAKEEKEKKPRALATPTTEEQPPSPIQAKKQPSRKSTMEVKIAPTPSPASEKKSEIAPVPKSASLPPIKYAAAAAAAVAAGSMPSVPPPAMETLSPQQSKVEVPAESPAEIEEELAELKIKEQSPSPISAPPPPPGLGLSPTPSSQPQPSQSATSPSALAPAPTFGNGSTPSPNPPPGYAPSGTTSAPHAESSRAASNFGASPRPQQGVLGNLMHSFDVAKELSERRGTDVNELHAALEGSLASAPHQLDSEPPRYYHPKNPVKTPSYYPQARAPILEDKTIYSRLDMDQLFYIFYYMTGTYEQWLAAQELKRQSWRFHKQYLTWFQRAHNPQAITEDYEQGGYFYFDWENSWCQRKKSDFRFEYRWLSDH